MFQRFKNALDQSIAQEQARHKALSEQRASSPSGSSTPNRRSGSVSRTNSSKDSSARRKTKKSSQDISNGDNGLNPDPAVFEAAFAIGDDETDTRASTPKPPVPDKDVTEDKEASAAAGDRSEDTKEALEGENKGFTPTVTVTDSNGNDAASAPASTPADLPPEVKAKLRKLDKLEKTYPELLRSYRIAHGRATSIEPFEKALRESTPLTSIKDPNALVEYLNQLNLKGDMVMDEFKRVSAEKDILKKKFEDTDKELVALREEVAAMKAAKAQGTLAETGAKTDEDAEGKKDNEELKRAASPSTSKSPVSSILGVFSPNQKPQSTDESKDVSEDMFSYDEEIPQLQAEVASKSEEITKLRSEVGTLKDELVVVKEYSKGLLESLEKATREVSKSRDATAVQDSLQTQLDARNTEIKSLTEKLEKTQTQLRDVEANLQKEKSAAAAASKELETKLDDRDKDNVHLGSQLKSSAEAKSALENKIKNLAAEIATLKKYKVETEERIEKLNKQIQDNAQPAPTATPSDKSLEVPAVSCAPGGSKKRNKKKKKGGATTATVEPTPSQNSEQTPTSPVVESVDTLCLYEEIGKLKDEIAHKDTQIERLSKQRKTEEDLHEELENMQENLLSIGQDHVEAKQNIKELEVDKSNLQSRIAELEKEIASDALQAKSNSALQTELDLLRNEYDELKIKSSILASDLGAAQQLAQSRYKDLTDLRDVLSKAQPELKLLRQDAATLKTTKDELASKLTELRGLEKREKDLKVEVARVQRIATDREAEMRNLNDRLAVEAKMRARLEDEKRVAGRDYRRSEAERVELSAKAEKIAREIEPLQAELSSIRPKISSLESQISNLQKEKDALKEDADLKAAQYNSVQGLLSSMRDQTAELSVQLKEAQSQAESLEEELAEAQKHLQERTREGETMRRMIAEVDEKADQKVREMRSRLEATVEERDRIEDESSTLARRRARESEELRQKVRELEREMKTLAAEKDDLELREREWRKRREELERTEEKTSAEAEDMRQAVANLRSALDNSESSVREAEKQRADMRKVLDESRARYEKLAKELKMAQARIAGAPVASSGRSSIDSNRSGTPSHGASTGGGQAVGVDTLYLKTILLQFLEVKDEKVRGQLVPVLGKLLRFDRNDEQKWLNAVQHLSKSGR